VGDGEGPPVHPLLREVGVLCVRLLDLVEPRGVGAGGEEALLREEREDARARVVDELDHLFARIRS